MLAPRALQWRLRIDRVGKEQAMSRTTEVRRKGPRSAEERKRAVLRRARSVQSAYSVGGNKKSGGDTHRSRSWRSRRMSRSHEPPCALDDQLRIAAAVHYRNRRSSGLTLADIRHLRKSASRSPIAAPSISPSAVAASISAATWRHVESVRRSAGRRFRCRADMTAPAACPSGRE